jgi:hypothetical protein
MIVIADTSPINYLILIDAIDTLKALFGRVIIPQAVFDELQREKTPREVKAWMTLRPEWLTVQQASRSHLSPQKRLGDGEREAITLAIELQADAVKQPSAFHPLKSLQRCLRETRSENKPGKNRARSISVSAGGGDSYCPKRA